MGAECTESLFLNILRIASCFLLNRYLLMGNSVSSPSPHRISSASHPTKSLTSGSTSVPKYLKPSTKYDLKTRKQLKERKQKSKQEDIPKKHRPRLEFNFVGALATPLSLDDGHKFVDGRKFFSTEVEKKSLFLTHSLTPNIRV